MALSPGTCLGPYETSGLIGAGGMGEVYRARDTRLDREVAVKVLPERVAKDPDALARFEREARTVAGLNDPHVCSLHDVGTEGDVHYAVFELLEGETLRERLSRGALSPTVAVELAMQMCQGLAAAHSKGIVHRDLKPENVFLTRQGLKILDFGLAKLQPVGGGAGEEGFSREQTLSAQGQLTSPGTAPGTVAYMSPEQARGEAADASSDIFAAGVMLYEMLSGRRPFRRDTHPETLTAILKEDTPELTSPAGPVPPGLERIVRRCLEKDPERRFHSAEDVAFALEAVSERRPAVAPSGPPPTRHWWRPAALAAVLVLGLAGLGLWLRPSPEPLIAPDASAPIRSLAVLPLENLSGDPDQEYFADGMTEALIADLAKIKALRVISRTSVMQYKGIKKPLPQIASELGVDAVVEGSVMRSGDRMRITTQLVRAVPEEHLWAESYERELRDVLALQSDVARRIAEAVEASVTPDEEARLAGAETVGPEAHEAYLKGLYFWTVGGSYEKAAEYFQQAREADPDFAPAYAKLAECYVLDGILAARAPREAFADAEIVARQALELDDTLAEAHTALAEISAHRDWDWVAADRALNRALALNPNYAIALFRHSSHLVARGRVDEGIAAARRAQNLDPLTPQSRAYLADILRHAHHYAESISQAQKALELDPDFSWAHHILGRDYAALNMHEEAMSALRKALTLAPEDLRLKAELGRVYAGAGRRDHARQVVRELRNAPEPSRVSSFDMAGLLAALGEKDEALDLLEGAFEERLGAVVWINVDPMFDPLRDEPRFQALVARLNLPDSSSLTGDPE